MEIRSFKPFHLLNVTCRLRDAFALLATAGVNLEAPIRKAFMVELNFALAIESCQRRASSAHQ